MIRFIRSPHPWFAVSVRFVSTPDPVICFGARTNKSGLFTQPCQIRTDDHFTFKKFYIKMFVFTRLIEGNAKRAVRR